MKEQTKPIKTIFCANDQVEQAHELTASPSGEIVATCTVCGRMLKFPASLTPDEFQVLVDQHKEANEGQVTQESIDKSLSEFADNNK